MRIRLAKTAGFCMGVKNAIQKAIKTAINEDEIYTCGQLIHNKQAVEALQTKGIIAVQDWKSIEQGTILIRAHGMPKDIIDEMRDKGLNLVDATCPHVLGSQKKIQKYFEMGYFVIIVGDREHPEIQSLQSFAGDFHCVISNLNDIDSVPEHPQYIVIAQTTFNKNEYDEICQALTTRLKDCLVFDSICLATSNRQEEVKNIAGEVDAVIVVGGLNSANTRRLAEIAEKCGKPAFHIETADDLDLEKIMRFDSVGITAGASTPHWITNEVIETLRRLEKEKQPIKYYMNKTLNFLANSNLFVSFSAAMLTIYSLIIYNYPVPIFGKADFLFFPALTFSFIFSMYHFNNNLKVKSDNREISELLYLPERNLFLHQYFFSFSILSWVLISLSLVISCAISIRIFSVLLAGYAAGLIYDRKILPRFITLKKLKDIPVSKDVFIAAALTVLSAFLPLLRYGIDLGPKQIYLMCFIFCLTFLKSVSLDLRDIEGDRIIGRETLPVFISKKYTQIFIVIFSTALLIGTIYVLFAKGFPAVSWLLLTGPVYICLYTLLKNTEILKDELYCEIIIDGMYIFLGTAGLIWTMLS